MRIGEYACKSTNKNDICRMKVSCYPRPGNQLQQQPMRFLQKNSQ